MPCVPSLKISIRNSNFNLGFDQWPRRKYKLDELFVSVGFATKIKMADTANISCQLKNYTQWLKTKSNRVEPFSSLDEPDERR